MALYSLINKAFLAHLGKRALIALIMLSFSTCSTTIIDTKQSLTPTTSNSPVPSTPEITASDFISFDGTHLALRSWIPKEPPRAVVIAVHGFNDYSHFIHDAASYFVQQSIAVYAYDQRGFGESANHGIWPGNHVMAQDLHTLLTLIQQEYPDQPLFLLGESMGAAVVLYTLAKYGSQTEGIILSAPAVWGWNAMPLWQRWGLKMAAATMPSMTFTGESLHIKASDNHDMLLALSRDPLIIKATRVDAIYGLVELMQAGSEAVHTPALILYGEKDEVIPKKPILETLGKQVSRSNNQRLQLYKHGYHMLLRDLQAKVVWKDILNWMQDKHAPLPSERMGLSSSYNPQAEHKGMINQHKKATNTEL